MRRGGRHKNSNGFLLTHGSTIFSRWAFLVKPHPVLRRRYSRWMFLAVRPLPLFSFLSLFSPRLFPTWLAPLPRISSPPQYVWPLLCSCTGACIGEPLSWSRYDRGLNTNYVSVRLFCGFARYRSYRNALLYSARIPSLPYYTSCISDIIPT